MSRLSQGGGKISPRTKLIIVAATAVIAVVLVVVGIASLKPKSEPESVNRSPVARFVYDADNLTVSFDASTSGDSDGSIVSYSWTFGDGEEKNSSAPVIIHEYGENGTYSVSLTVTDNGNAKNHTSKDVTVKKEEVPKRPKADIEVVKTDSLTVDLSAAESEAYEGRTIVNYTWAFGDGSMAYGVDVSHAYAANGTYDVNLTVTDSGGLNDTDSESVTVQKTVPPVHKAPLADILVLDIDNLSVILSGVDSEAYDGETIENYTWSFGDGAIAYGVDVSHTYAANGTYKVNLTVTDSKGLKNTTSDSITVVSPMPPTPPHKAPRAKIEIIEIENRTVTLTGESSRAFDGYEIVNYTWSFGDGGKAYGVQVTHTYAANGTYTVTLTVTDDSPLSNTTSVAVTVSSGPPEPPPEKQGPPGLYHAIEVHEQLVQKNPKLQNSLDHLRENLERWIAKQGTLAPP